MRRLTLGLSAAALIFAGTVLAAEENSHASMPESRDQAQTRAGQLFDKLDLNHDGKLDQSDRAARMAAHTGEMFDRLDTNHDGMISRAEFAAAHEHMLGEQAGLDHEGPDQEGPDQSGTGEEHRGGHMGHSGYKHRELGGLVMLIVERADPNHTGTVTRNAFIGGALSLFNQADTDHNHVLTPEEHRVFGELMRQQMRAKWQQHGDHEHGEPGQDDMPPPPSPAH